MLVKNIRTKENKIQNKLTRRKKPKKGMRFIFIVK